MKPFDHRPLLARFRADLRGGKASAEIIRKHITTGEPVGITPETYYALRSKVADRFDVHPNAVVLVGSCRLGFSLKPKNGVRYKRMSAVADVDVAVVSDRLFDEYWDRVFDVVQDDRGWATREGRRFTRDLFSGWVSPQTLPNLPRFSNARQWAEFFAKLTQQRLCGYRSISARLYRSWYRLEAYQRIMVEACRSELEVMS